MKRQALLMIELLIAVLIIAISAGAIALSTDIWTLTAKREAEKLASRLHSLTLKADKIKTHFQIMVDSRQNKLTVQWNNSHTSLLHEHNIYTEDFFADEGCSYSWNAPHDVVYYSYLTNRFSQGTTITVTGKGPTYYVVIATIGSRVRVSEAPPPPPVNLISPLLLV